MKKYLIIYNNVQTAACAEDIKYLNMELKAENIKELIKKLAFNTRCSQKLFGVALNGCQTDEDCIEMYNHFSDYMIDNIYIIEEKVYSKENNRILASECAI